MYSNIQKPNNHLLISTNLASHCCLIKHFSPHHQTNVTTSVKWDLTHASHPFASCETVWVNTCTQRWQARSGNEGFGVLSRYIMQQMAFRPSLPRPLPGGRERTSGKEEMDELEKDGWGTRLLSLFLLVCLTFRNTCVFCCLAGPLGCLGQE